MDGNVVRRLFGTHAIDVRPDALGNVRSAKGKPGGGVETTVGYDAVGRRTDTHDAELGASEQVHYDDALGRLTLRERTIPSLEGPLTHREVRSYTDSPGDHVVTITEEVPDGPAPWTKTRTLHLDDAGRVWKTEDAAEGTRTLELDYRGNAVVERFLSAEDGEVSIQRAYDPRGALVEITDAEGVTTTRIVDASGRVLEQQGPHREEHWTFGFDAFGRPLHRTLDAAGTTPSATWTWKYDGLAPGAVEEETDPRGYTTIRWVNARRKLLGELRTDVKSAERPGTERKSSNTQMTEYGYDGPWLARRKVTEGGWAHLLDRTEIDDRGRTRHESESWSADGELYDYGTTTGWEGRSATVSEVTGGTFGGTRTYRLQVDGLGNVIQRTEGVLIDGWIYDPSGQLLQSRPAGQPMTTHQYLAGQLRSTVAGSETTSYSYWPNGSLEAVTEPSGRARRYRWSPRNLLRQESYGTSVERDVVGYEYDAGGFIAARTVGSGTQDAARWGYDSGPRGELRGVRLPDGSGSTFTYAYDAGLRLTGITPPSGPALAFEHDYLGREVRRTRGGATWSTAWSSGEAELRVPAATGVDRIVTLLDGRGRAARVGYFSASGADGDLDGFRAYHDASDRLTRVDETRASGDVAVERTYDASGRLEVVRRGTREVRYGYAGTREPSDITSPGGSVSYAYDPLTGRVSSITSLAGRVAVGWEPGGAHILSLEGEALSECYAYDLRGRVSSVKGYLAGTSCNSPGMSDPLVATTYDRYDERGNRLEETYVSGLLKPEKTTYGYDAADRLTGVLRPNGDATLYGLALDGTRRCEKEVPSYAGSLGDGMSDPCTQDLSATRQVEYRYDAQGGLKEIADLLAGGGALEAAYDTDPSGRVLRETRGEQVKEFGWDAGSRLGRVTVRGPGAAEATSRYAYDYAGLRVKKAGPGGDTSYVWGDGELVEERFAGATGERVHLYQRVAGIAVGVGAEQLMHDGLGTVIGRMGAGAVAPEVYRHDAWGGFAGVAPGASDPSLAYAGQHWDADAGLSYAQQRWYEPGTGRFLSEDPVGWNAERLGQPTRGHAFGYAAGNPLLYTDPEGLDVGQPESTTRRAQQEAAQVEAFMKFSAGVDPRSPEFRSLAYSFSGLTSPDGNGFARFDKDALDALCTQADRSACELLAQNELNQLGAGVALAATPGVAARLIKPASKLIPLLMKAWLAVSVATMHHDAPGGAPVRDPVTYATQQVVTNAATCWGGQGETPERARACIGHATDAATLGLASLETKPGKAAVDLLSRLEFGYTEEQLSRFYSFPGPLPVRLKGATTADPLPAGTEPYQLELFPAEPYNRVEHYGYTPTEAQRASVPAGMEFDHSPSLVRHYYEGPGGRRLPGYNLTQPEREAFGARLDSGGPATPAQQRAQGAAEAAYSKRMKKRWGLR